MHSKLEDAENSKNETENLMPTTPAVGSTSKAACPLSIQTDWTETVLPKYETNKDKFLVSFKNFSSSKNS